MKTYQSEFLKLTIDNEIIRFGEFTLKSGRVSPYFYNSGLFDTGELLAQLGKYYAQTIIDAKIEFDVLFGPAYKGIPLVCTTACALATKFNIDKPYAFNRKEAKDHGEGGQIVGADVKDKKILIIDDVITAGTAINESMQLLNKAGAKLASIVISLDRQEKNNNGISPIKHVEQTYQASVISIVTLNEIIEFANTHLPEETLKKITDYRKAYGV